MKSRYYYLPVLALLLAVGLASCNVNGYFSQNVTGSGIVVNEVRQVDEFSGIRATGIFKVFVTIGDHWHVEVVTDDNIHPYVTTRISDHTLIIETTERVNFRPATKLHVHVTTPEIYAVRTSGASTVYLETPLEQHTLYLHASGSSDIFAEAYVDELEANSSGSSDIHISGHAHKASVSASGSSDFKGSGFSCEEAHVRLSGSSDAWINVHLLVTGNLSGSSDLHLSGDAKVDVNTSGSSKVRR